MIVVTAKILYDNRTYLANSAAAALTYMKGNPAFPGPYSYTQPDPTNAFYNSRGNTTYEPPDPDGIPPEAGVAGGAAIVLMKYIQDYTERNPARQDATKYVIPKLGPR